MIKGGRAGRLLEASLRRISQSGGKIVDLGTPQRFHKELRPFESLFKGRDYKAFGFEPSSEHGPYNADGHEDIEALTFGDGEVDAVICLDVLEHVSDPFQAAREISRVLRPAGLLLLTVPFQGGYHGKSGGTQRHDAYPDYWRMTHAGLELLFRSFADVKVTPTDGPIEFRLRQFYLGPLLDHPMVRPLVDAIDRPSNGRATSRHLLFGRK
jgi:SAM-dependent methyltransferase